MQKSSVFLGLQGVEEKRILQKGKRNDGFYFGLRHVDDRKVIREAIRWFQAGCQGLPDSIQILQSLMEAGLLQEMVVEGGRKGGNE